MQHIFLQRVIFENTINNNRQVINNIQVKILAQKSRHWEIINITSMITI